MRGQELGHLLPAFPSRLFQMGPLLCRLLLLGVDYISERERQGLVLAEHFLGQALLQHYLCTC